MGIGQRVFGGRCRAAVVVLLCSALTASASAAQIEPRSPQQPPDLLELTGHVGKPLPGETGGWNLVLGDRYKDHTFAFHLSHMRILNSGRLPLDVLSAVEPYRPNFFLFPASPEQMATIEASSANDRLTITGYRHIGSRNILLTKVERAPAPASPESASTP